MPLAPQTIGLELTHEQYMRLSAESRRLGKSRQAILRGWILPQLDKLLPAEFEVVGDHDED
jgi:hypothetical protein